MAEKTNPENNMALDEIIKNDKTGKYKRFNRRRRNYRSYNNNDRNRNNDFKKDTRRRIRVENLNKEMQNTDLTKLFEGYGKLTRCGIRYDKMGASTGNADIEFSTHEECEAAIKKLDNAEINGVTVRVKYASSIRRPFRRVKSAGAQRRTVRRINRATGRRNLRRRVVRNRTGNNSGSIRNRREGSRKRRVFTRTLGRKRVTKRK